MRDQPAFFAFILDTSNTSLLERPSIVLQLKFMKENIILNDQILFIDVSNIGHWSME